VRGIVENMPLTAKLKGLAALIDQHKRQNPERWPEGLTVRKRKARRKAIGTRTPKAFATTSTHEFGQRSS
jgi:hypothetical protein